MGHYTHQSHLQTRPRIPTFLTLYRYKKFIRPASVIYMGVVIEYLLAEVLELAQEQANAKKRRKTKRMTIDARDIMMPVWSSTVCSGL